MFLLFSLDHRPQNTEGKKELLWDLVAPLGVLAGTDACVRLAVRQILRRS